MSQETNETAPSSPTSPVTPWTHLLGGVLFLAVAAVAAAVLLLQFLANRPINLRSHTTSLAMAFTRALEAEHVPASDIRQSAVEVRRTPQAVWHFYRFEVAVPQHVNPDDLKESVRASMRRRQVTLVDAAGGAPGREFSLDLAGFEFAHAVLKTTAPRAAPRSDLRAASGRIAEEVRQVLVRVGIPPEDLKLEDPVEREDSETVWAMVRMRAALRASLTADAIGKRIEDALIERGVHVSGVSASGNATLLRVAYAGKNCVEVLCRPESAAPGTSAAPGGPLSAEGLRPPSLPSFDELPLDSLEHAMPDEAPMRLPGLPKMPTPATGARIAIILDDGGYGGPVTDRVLELDAGLTLAILPNTPFAGETARQASEKGFEVMLHMPMETHSKIVKPFPGQVDVGMDVANIQTLTRTALEQVPGAVGANNHTGSVFTSNSEKMKAFLEVLKERSLYFVDSRTIASTVASAVAREIGVNTAERDIFLDNDKAPEKIRAQLAKLIEVAKTQGHALGIGHFRESTVSVLAEELPKLAQSGVTLVHASEVVR